MAIGRKTGGRQKGALNKKTAEKVYAIESSGLTPLDYMLSVLRAADSSSEDRMWAAKEAAPYCHPRLSAIDHTVKRQTAREISDDELADIIARGSDGIPAPPPSKAKLN
jgi:hypothetical protein